jgi:hypothetical protein
MGRILNTQGEPVAFKALGNGTDPFQVAFYDSNNNVRVLQPFEQFIVDMAYIDDTSAELMEIFADQALTIGPFISTVTDAAAFAFNGGSPGTADYGTLLYRYSPIGLSFPVGYTPWVTSGGTGQGNVFGMGRIIQGTTQGHRPNWRERLNGPGAI